MNGKKSRRLSSVLCVLLTVLLIASSCVGVSAAVTGYDSGASGYANGTDAADLAGTGAGGDSNIGENPGGGGGGNSVIGEEPTSSPGGGGGGGGGGSSTTTLATPRITGFTSLDSGTRITWGSVYGAAMYRVYYLSGGSWRSIGDTTSTSLIHTGVKSGSTYTYTVRCINAYGTAFTSSFNASGWTYTYNMATPQITKLESTTTGVKITWGAVANAKKYRVYYKTGSASWTKLGDTTSTTYTHTAARSGVTYRYTVRCLNTAATVFTSSFSSTGWSHTYSPPLATPQVTRLENVSSGVRITWGAVSGAQKYRVYYKTGSASWTKLGDTTSTAYTHTSASAGTTYYYTVRCLNSAATAFTSGFSATGWSHTYLLSTPQITKLESASNGVKLTWGAVSGAAKYRIYYKTGSASWTKLADTTSTTYTHLTAVRGTTYFYTVRCLNSAATVFTSGFSATGWSHTFYLNTPQITKLESTSTGVKLTWGAVSGAAKYRIYYKTGSASWTKLADTTSTTYTHTAVSAGTTYSYTVRCLNSAATVFTSSFSSTGWSHTYLLSTPQVTKLENTTSGVRITWGAVTGAQKYRVYYKTGSASWTKLADTAVTYLTHSSAAAGVTYSYTVRCLNSAGTVFTSSFSSTGWTHTYQPLLNTPQITKLEGTSTGVRITWGAVGGAQKYRVYYKTGTGSWTKLADSAVPYLTHSAAVPGSTYSYTVRCLNSAGTEFTSSYNASGWSITYLLNTPQVTKLESTSTGVRITWGAVGGAQKYRVFYKTSSSANWTKLGDSAVTSYTHTGVTYGSTYYYTVRCINSAGNVFTSGYSSSGWSYTYSYRDPATLLSTPTIIYFEEADRGIRIAWMSVDGAEKYRIFYKTSSGAGWTKLGDTTSTVYNHTGAQRGSTYYYTVRCINADGSAFTSGYNATGWSYTYQLLNQPWITWVGDSGDSARVNWTTVEGAQKYRVLYRTEDSDWMTLTDTGDSYCYHTGGEPGMLYYYTVRCVNADGTDYTSDYDSYGTDHVYPSLEVPEIYSFDDEPGAVHIYWYSVYGAEQYRVYYRTEYSEWMTLTDTYDTACTHTGGAPSTLYYYTVRCINSDGTAYTSGYNTYGWGYTFPRLSAPVLAGFDDTEDGVVITWDPVPGAEYYDVYRNDSGYWYWLETTDQTSWTDSNVVDGGTYTYRVVCVSEEGDEISDYDVSGWNHTYTAPANSEYVDMYLDADLYTQFAAIYWDNVPRASEYYIYISDSSWNKYAEEWTSDLYYLLNYGTNHDSIYHVFVDAVSYDGKVVGSGYMTLYL